MLRINGRKGHIASIWDPFISRAFAALFCAVYLEEF